MPDELFWLAATALMTGLMFLPYVVARFAAVGFWTIASCREGRAYEDPPWAMRLVKAHRNAVENLAVFGPLALGVVVAGAGSPLTAGACAVYFVARAVHAAAYTAALPFTRGPAFMTGVACQVILALRLLGVV